MTKFTALEFPLVTGLNETADDKLLPQGALSDAFDVVIKKDGQCLPRPSLTSLGRLTGENPIPTPIKGAITDAGENFQVSKYTDRIERVGVPFSQMSVTRSTDLGGQGGAAYNGLFVEKPDGLWSITIADPRSYSVTRRNKENFEVDYRFTQEPDARGNIFTPGSGELKVLGLFSGADDVVVVYVETNDRGEDPTGENKSLFMFRTGNPGALEEIPIGNLGWGPDSENYFGCVAKAVGKRTHIVLMKTYNQGEGETPAGDYALLIYEDLSRKSVQTFSVTTPLTGWFSLLADDAGFFYVFGNRVQQIDKYSLITGAYNSAVTDDTNVNMSESGALFCNGGLPVWAIMEPAYLYKNVLGDSDITNREWELDSTWSFPFKPVSEPVLKNGFWYYVASRAVSDSYIYETLADTPALEYANQQACVVRMGADSKREIVAYIPGSNIGPQKSAAYTASLHINDAGKIYVSYLQYIDGVSIKAREFICEPWTKAAEQSRDREEFYLGALDNFYDGERVAHASFISPPYVNARGPLAPNDPADYGTPGYLTEPSDAQDPPTFDSYFGELTVYVTVEFTDANGRLHVSAPTVVKLLPYFWKTSQSGTLDRYRWDVGQLSVDITAPVGFTGGSTMIARVWTKGLNEVYLTDSEREDISTLPARLSNTTALAVETSSTAILPGQTVNVFIAGGYGDSYDNGPYVPSSNGPTNTLSSAVLYTETGEVPNAHAPTGRAFVMGKSRMFRSEYDGSSTIVASKLVSDPIAVEWSDLDTFRVSLNAPITGLAYMDSSIVAFTRHSIQLVAGSGPSQTGEGAFSDPVSIPGDIGCISPESVIAVPNGILFQSDRGIYLLNRGFSAPVWVGEQARGLVNSSDVCLGSVFTIKDDTVRWSFENEDGAGYILAYNRRNGQWFRHSTISGDLPVKIVGSRPIEGEASLVATSSASLLEFSSVEEPGLNPTIETGWLRMAGINGHWQGRKLYLLGEKFGETSVKVEIAYNDGDFGKWEHSFSLEKFERGAVNLVLTIPIQKFDSMKVRVSWDSGNTGSFMLNGVSLYYEKFRGGPRLGRRSRG